MNRRRPEQRGYPNSNPGKVYTASNSNDSSDYETAASYFREVGAFKLLSREDEVQIAKRIEAGEHIIMRALLQTPAAAEHIIQLGRQVEEGTVDAKRSFRAVKNGKGTPGAVDANRQFLNTVKQIKKLHGINRIFRARLMADDLAVERRRHLHQSINRRCNRLADLLQEWRINPEIIESMVDDIRSQADRIDVQSIEQIEIKLGMNTGRLSRILDRIDYGCRMAQTAKNEFVTANLRLVFRIARQYAFGKLQLLDCIQEGNLGLMKAVDKFDFRLGFKFSTYATWWIKQAIFRAIDNQSRLIRIPVHMNENLKKIMRTARTLATEENPRTHAEEIAAELDIPREDVDEMLKLDEEPLSLNAPLREPGGHDWGHLISDGESHGPLDAVINRDAGEKIRKALATLSPREERVLRLRFGIGETTEHTLDEISRDFALTRERIRQIEAKALQKLRNPKQLRQLACFIEN
ncbi:MAG: sigma-70 family RNA polymerase sigma factor [Desulfobacterales bacterium]|nr:MAG: sigma-70 family RNA polymerase sigma factor [Desulfobacterales bacterium]